MTDVLSKKQRHLCMSQIKGKDTSPEIIIRKALFSLGYRYRLHDAKLPGKPDLVLPKYNAIININGCFWHQHRCHLFKWPSSKVEFWRRKLTENKKRDRKNYKLLKDQGWYILTIWECALKGKKKLDLIDITEDIVKWLEFETGDKVIKGMSKTYSIL